MVKANTLVLISYDIPDHILAPLRFNFQFNLPDNKSKLAIKDL